MTEQPYDIHKAAAIIINDRKAILTRSKGKNVFVPPGGKLEQGESEIQACIREVNEELGISITESDLEYMDTFYAEAAGSSGKALKMGVYLVTNYSGEILPQSEIEEIISIGAAVPEGLEIGSIFLHNITPLLKQANLVD